MVSALLVAGGCASAPAGSPEVTPIVLRSPAGAHARCGIEFIREVQRADDLGWSEQLIYTWSARSDARQAVRAEEEWRQRCVERYRQQGFEVVAGPR